jgi:TolA-binding protein
VAQHLTRKELKKDQIREGFVHGAEAVASHPLQLWSFGIAALVVVIAVLGWRFYTQTQTARAAAALADATTVYEARIRAANEPAAPGEVTYVDQKNKYADAVKKFTDVANRYPHTRPGQVARYYAGLSLAQLDRHDDAEKDFKMVESGGDEGLAALARFQLAQLYDQTGKAAQAAQIYQQLADKPNLFVPRAVVLLALADHYSSTDPAQASKLYNQVKSEFPDSPAAQEADEHLQLLPVKS